MKCPYCNMDMTAGNIQVRTSWLSFLFWGLQFQDLSFDAGDQPRVVLGPRAERAAFLCPSCGATVIEGEPPRKDGALDPHTGVVTESRQEAGRSARQESE